MERAERTVAAGQGGQTDHRERVLRALNHQTPDRVPREASLAPALVDALRAGTGIADYREHFDLDFATVGFEPPDPLPDYAAIYGRYYQDADLPAQFSPGWPYPAEWGVAHALADYYQIGRPLHAMRSFTSLRQLEEFPFPDYLRDWRHDHLEREVRRIHQQGYPACANPGWIFQTAWYLRSHERIFIDFLDNPEFADALLSRIARIRIAAAVRLAEAGIDFFRLADDIAIQTGLFMRPATWRRFIKPHLAALIAAVKRANPGVHVGYHSDGQIQAVIPDLIEIGVTALTTVQPECIDVFAVKRRWGDAIALGGTIGCQSTLSLGTPDEVRQTVREQIEALGRGGGFILSPANGVEPDAPWENVVALFEAAEEYGWYR